MKKTLSIQIPDIENVEGLTIMGSLNEVEFNKNVVIKIGNAAVVVNSQQLAKGLQEVVHFQTVEAPPPVVPVTKNDSFYIPPISEELITYFKKDN